jgi:CRP/FNR family transcriptional regulator, dissimilatory nitrate respiration regulator
MKAVLNPTANRDHRLLVEGVIGNLMLFREATPGQIAGVASRSWTLAARRGDTLAGRGEPLPGVFAVAYGQVKLSLSNASNEEERVLRLVSAGQVFGMSTALLGRPSQYAALALMESKLIVIPPTAIYALLDCDPRFARGMVKSLAETAFALVIEIESATLRGAAQRLASYLGSLPKAKDQPGACTVRLPMSKTLIAARLGMKKETLSRLLRSLARQGLIEVRRDEIALIDRERLDSLSS